MKGWNIENNRSINCDIALNRDDLLTAKQVSRLYRKDMYSMKRLATEWHHYDTDYKKERFVSKEIIKFIDNQIKNKERIKKRKRIKLLTRKLNKNRYN